MAGIGFTLRRLLDSDDLAGPLRALGLAAVIAAGPWICSSTALAFLGTFSAIAGQKGDQSVFLALVNYTFAFSLIGVGLFEMVSSRYLADRLFEERWEHFSPTFAQVLAPMLLLQALACVLFLAYVPLTLPIKLAALHLYLAVSGTWLAMIFLSAANDYRMIVGSFAVGLTVSALAGLALGALWGLLGQLTGFTAGFVVIFFALAMRIRAEFGLPQLVSRALASYYKRFWPLVVTGFSYNLAIWIDKILFWYHPEAGQEIAGALHAAPLYDNAMFMAYLTVIPALAMFLLRVETDFYDAYRAYFAAIAAQATFQELGRAKEAMLAALRRNVALLLKVQAPLTLSVIIFAPEIVERLHISWMSLFVFRFGAFGAVFHVLTLMLMILILYLDFRLEAMALALTFFAANTAFTVLSFHAGLPAYGMGYALACGVSFLIGLALLGRAFERLEYHVFMRQPLS